MTVHGHPDDETVNTGGVMARYAAEGARVVCVVATLGEVGRIVAPTLDTPANRADLGRLREAELRLAVAALAPDGGIQVVLLGYRDSGMAGTPENADPASFWQADLAGAVDRLLEIIRRERPDVIVSPNGYGTDGHPDHIKAAAVAKMAFARTAEPDFQAGSLPGEPAWRPAKLYETVVGVGKRRERLRRLVASGDLRTVLGVGVRYVRAWRPGSELERARIARAQGPVTTRVDVRPQLGRKAEAMRAHRSQIHPRSQPFALPLRTRRDVSPTEDFSLCESRVGVSLPETDLFAGLRQRADEAAARS
ncbi:MAG TPA: PIG-L family deacetylase [Candidatus Baltobacteraceae bacterium]|nr:PIG-L family deacetylase [Candidatus Baltobacteraceae bacterium]